MANAHDRPERVAITGMGLQCSIGRRVDSFTEALWTGRSGIEFVGEHGDQKPNVAAIIRDFDFPSAVEECVSLPASLRQTARRVAFRSPFPVQVGVVAAMHAWADAGLVDVPLPPDRIGVVVAGNNLNGGHWEKQLPKYLANPAHLSGRYALHFQDTDHVATLSHILGITGEGFTIGAASASGNVGIISGARLIELGAVDACLVVGALTDLSSMERQAFFNLGAMGGKGEVSSPDMVCRPFDEANEGFVYGQGAACLVLEAERSARARGVVIQAGVGGYGLKLDANHLADPREGGEAVAMQQAISRAGLRPEDIGYVNAHGSGSPIGDRTEIRALRQVMGEHFRQPWVNSTKALVGHCLCAAAVLEAVATVVQMREGFLHGNAGLTRPVDSECRFVGPSSELADVECSMSNSFGFGGFNTSIVLRRGESVTGTGSRQGGAGIDAGRLGP